MHHGKPTWFELTTTPGALSAAGDFYARTFGWAITDAGMEGFTYHLASHGGDMVAGLMETPAGKEEMPPHWILYIDVDDCDATAARAAELGGQVVMPPADIPGTGRFAILTDPQGAAFGILQPLPMDPQPPADAGAFNQRKDGHGNWIELMSTDPDAGFAFYADLFGWTRSDALDMGEMGTYRLFAHHGTQIGGMMGLGHAPQPHWLPYFGVNGVTSAIRRITEAGGALQQGPHEVPGPAHIAVATDPQGAWFAIVGPLEDM